MSLLNVSGVSKTFNGRRVLNDLEFELDRGQRLAVIGPNGSGKTTLIKIVALLEKPTTGLVHFDGAKVGEIRDEWHVMRRMAVVFQRPPLLRLSVFDNVTVGLWIRGIDKAETQNRVKGVLDRFGLLDLACADAHLLSGGERQLLSLARAVVLEPELLLLDEPVSALDPANASLAAEVLEEMKSAIIATSPTENKITRLCNHTLNI